ncbi:MAG: RimK family alpha-L-glutamate ligase [Proteobacteria bacterium]|nr:RimK family alpha-L-glutamate ligase [Pseudomonadota bacterium]
MKVWILSKGKKFTPARQNFKKAADLLQIDLEFPDIRALSKKDPALLDDEALPDVVISRLGAAAKKRELALIDQLEKQGCYIFNRAAAIRVAGNKYEAGKILAMNGLPVPKKTLLGRSTTADALVADHGLPIVFKPVRGAKGDGVQLIRTLPDLVDTLKRTQQQDGQKQYLFEDFIAHSHGRDLRVFVVSGEIVGNMQRVGRGDDFRANIAKGGRGHKHALDAAARDISIRAVQALNLDIGGVDLLFTEGGGYTICEVNASPGFSEIEKANPNLNIALAILKGCIKHPRNTAQSPSRLIA